MSGSVSRSTQPSAPFSASHSAQHLSSRAEQLSASVSEDIRDDTGTAVVDNDNDKDLDANSFLKALPGVEHEDDMHFLDGLDLAIMKETNVCVEPIIIEREAQALKEVRRILELRVEPVLSLRRDGGMRKFFFCQNPPEHANDTFSNPWHHQSSFMSSNHRFIIPIFSY